MTTTVEDQLARLDSVLERLERLGLAAPPPEVEALAAGDIPPRVAAGELIQSSWGNAVVDALAADRHTLVITPALGGDWPAPNDGVTEWLGTNWTVPTWAHIAYVTTTLTMIRPTAAVNSVYQMRTRVGGVLDDGLVQWFPEVAINEPSTVTYTSRHPGITAGASLRFSVVVSRIVGTGVLVANAGSSCRFLVQYAP